MSQDKTIFAYTEPTTPPIGGYVGYFNISQNEQGKVIFTLRSNGTNPQQASLEIPEDQLDDLVDNLIAHFYLSQKKAG